MPQKRFQVAFSFPGEHRDYVVRIAEKLAETLGGKNILYDAWYKSEFTRPNLDTYLQNLYHNESQLIVPILCADYQNKDWCQLEWRVIRDLLKQKADDDIMPMRFDDTQITGLFDIDGYLDLNDYEPEEVAKLILERLEINGLLSIYSPHNGTSSKTETSDSSELLPKNIQIDRLPTVLGEFFGREEELKLLDNAFLKHNEHSETRIIQFIAAGGTGKTKLLRHWLNQREAEIDNYIIWSFYSQGTSDSKQVSSTPLFSEAFRELGIDASQHSTEEERADALADALTERQCLLILDGLEPLQQGGNGFDGQLKDRAIRRLLLRLALKHNGLCVISTRIHVHELLERAHVTSYPLDNLDTDDGVQLLRSLSVQGSRNELQKAVNEVEAHALTLHLLGNALTTYLDSDILKRDTLHELVDGFDNQGRHAFKVMQGYQDWLTDDNNKPTAELQLLYLLGLFDHPIEISVLQVLWDKQIPSLTARIAIRAWKIALRDLRDKHRLLSAHGERPDLLDCHPLIREYFGRQLQQQQPEAWQQAHETLYHYYKALPEDEQPDSVETMQPLFYAVAHGCAAGLHQRAVEEIYWERIKRKEEHYLTKNLGAFSDDLAVVAHFFSQPWGVPASGLTERWQSGALSWAGYRLRALGRLTEAVEPIEVATKNFARQKNWSEAAMNASTLSELQLSLGWVSDAIASGERSVSYADNSGDEFQRLGKRTTHADALYQAGQHDNALALFVEAEVIQQENQSGYPLLYSLQGFRYCDLLLAQGSSADVVDRALQTMEWLKLGGAGLLSVALDQLSLGRAYHALNDLAKALDWLDKAVKGFREAGRHDFLPRGLLARAALWRDLNEYTFAQQDLDEVWEISEHSGMRLIMADYYLEMARLLLNKQMNSSPENETGSVLRHIKAAESLVSETGYHRRDSELDALKSERVK